jgi:hypothetical protein
MQDNARGWIFCVRLDRAPLHAFRIQTVIASHRQVAALRVGPCSSFNLTKAPPVNLGWIAVLLIAGNLAGAAADALGHVEVKAILFTLLQFALWNEAWRRDRRPFQNARRSDQIKDRVPAGL